MNLKDDSQFKLFGLVFPVYTSKLLKYCLFVYLALFILCFLAIQFFGYELTDSDVPGGIISGFLLAYLISIL